MSLINPMAASTAVTNTATQVLSRDIRNQNLRPDQVITATVEEGGLERALLNLQGRKQWVETEIPLAAGQKITLEPIEGSSGRQLLLRPAQLDDYLRRIIHLVGRTIPLEKLTETLPTGDARPSTPPFWSQLLSPLLDKTPPGALWLRQLPNLLGLTLEKKLAKKTGPFADNLKAVMLQGAAKHLVDSGENRGEIVQILEACQLFQAKLALNGYYFLPLPLPEPNRGYVLFELSPKGKEKTGEEDPSTTIRLCLDLSALGPVTAVINHSQAGLSLRLEVQNDAAFRHLQRHRRDIEQALSSWNIQALHLFPETVSPERQLLQQLTAQSEGVVNARV